MTGIEQLRPDNHALYLRVQKLLNLRWAYEAICDDIGLVGSNRVNELCEWFIAYKSPKKLPMVKSRVLDVPTRSVAAADAEKFIAWRKQHEGARKALEAMGQ